MNDVEKAHAFVFGSLNPLERESVARERLYNRALDTLIIEEEERFAPLTAAAGEEDTPPNLLARILGAIAQEEGGRGELAFQSFGHGAWQNHPNPGIAFKTLWSEKTLLLRCEAGAYDNAHQQDADEHLLVIAGDVEMDGRTFSTGDYFMVAMGTTHSRMTTRGGCILFTQHI